MRKKITDELPAGKRAFHDTIDGAPITDSSNGKDVSDEFDLDGSKWIDPQHEVHDDPEDQGAKVVPLKTPEPIQKLIVDGVEKVRQLQQERKELNADIQLVYESIKAQGIDINAFKLAIKFSAMTEDQRNRMDFGFQECRKALGHPFQVELFDRHD